MLHEHGRPPAEDGQVPLRTIFIGQQRFGNLPQAGALEELGHDVVEHLLLVDSPPRARARCAVIAQLATLWRCRVWVLVAVRCAHVRTWSLLARADILLLFERVVDPHELLWTSVVAAQDALSPIQVVPQPAGFTVVPVCECGIQEELVRSLTNPLLHCGVAVVDLPRGPDAGGVCLKVLLCLSRKTLQCRSLLGNLRGVETYPHPGDAPPARRREDEEHDDHNGAEPTAEHHPLP
mmetsp:Transcript_1759/g.4806  ORF Transcript_1759/g.4806 Transcript_1759/m.4806 type:complete len:236 (-) Transcript_1759:1102-1809(-)